MKPLIHLPLTLVTSLLFVVLAGPALAEGLQSESYRLESGAFRVIGLSVESVGATSGTRLTSPTTAGALAAGSSSGVTSGVQLQGGWITGPVPVPEPSGLCVALAGLVALGRLRRRHALWTSRGSVRTAFLSACLLFFATSLANAGPAAISYQGTLVDSSGDPLVGPVDINFTFYASSDPADEAALYSEDHIDVALDPFGGFTLAVGTGSSPVGTFGPALFQVDELFLEVVVEGEALEPRQPVLSVAWALVASEVEGAPDLINDVAAATNQLNSFDAAFPGDQLGDALSALDDAVGSLQTSLSALTGDSSDSVIQQLAAATARLDSIEAIVGDPLESVSPPIATSEGFLDFAMSLDGANPLFAVIRTFDTGWGEAYELEFVACDDLLCSSSTTRSIASGYSETEEYCELWEYDPDTGEEFCTLWMTAENFYSISQQDVVVGSDGNPVLTYLDEYSGDLNLVRCADSTCSTTDAPVVISDGTTTNSSASGVLLGASGNPLVAFFDSVNDRLEMVVCSNASCSTSSTTTVTLAATSVHHLSVVLGDDGRPVVALHDSSDRDLEFARCGDAACSTIQTTTLASAGWVGSQVEVAIGADGAPLFAFLNQTDSVLQVLQCQDEGCSATGSAQSVDLASGAPSSSAVSLSLNASGRPVLAATTTPGGTLVTLTCWEADCAPSSHDVLRTWGADARAPKLLALDPVPSAIYVDAASSAESLQRTGVEEVTSLVLANQATAESAQNAANGAQSAATGAQADATSALLEIDGIESTLGVGTCGSLYDIQPSACPFSTADPYAALPNCEVAPNNSFCEGDGECSTNGLLNNCSGIYDVYYKVP